MEVDVKVDMPTKSLDEGNGAGFEVSCFVLLWVFFVEAELHRSFDASCYDGVGEAQDFAVEFGIPGAHIAKGHRHGENPLANDGGGREDVVGEVRSSFGHSSCATTSAKTSLFAAESDEALVFAIYTTEAQESVCEYSALEEGLEFLGDMLWKVLSLLAAKILEAAQVFLHDFVEQCAFGAAPLVAGIVPREGCLPVSVMVGAPCESLALLLHEGLSLQLQSHGCPRTSPCRSRWASSPVFSTIYSEVHFTTISTSFRPPFGCQALASRRRDLRLKLLSSCP